MGNPTGRRIDPKEVSEHWRHCDNPDCLLCNEGEALVSVRQAVRDGLKKAEDPTSKVTIPSPTTFEEALDYVSAICRKVMLNRQQKYGSGNISAFGRVGVLVRLSDKVERLKTLLSKGNTAADESEEDTWLDIANYGLIGLMLLSGLWGLPMETEVRDR